MNTYDFVLGYSCGNLDAYIYMIQRGVKKIGTPSILLPENSPFWDDVESKIKTIGLSMLTLDFRKAEPYKTNFVERIIFHKDNKHDALLAGELLLNKKKTKDINYELGRLFGYSKESIEKYLDK